MHTLIERHEGRQIQEDMNNLQHQKSVIAKAIMMIVMMKRYKVSHALVVGVDDGEA